MKAVVLATSRAERTIAPGVSSVRAVRHDPLLSIEPRVGLRAYKDCREAGCTMDPSFSAPMPMMAKPAEILTAVPVDDPPRLWVVVSATRKADTVW